MNIKIATALFIAIGFLAGCGGSGTSNSSTQTSTTAKVAITLQNQSTVTNSALNAATQDLSNGSLGKIETLIGVQTTVSSSNQRVISRWTDFAFN